MITRCHGRRGAATCQAITFFQTCQTKRQPVFGLLSVNRESMVGSENLQNRGRVSGHDCLKHDGKTLVNTCLTIHRFALRRSVLYLALSLSFSQHALWCPSCRMPQLHWNRNITGVAWKMPFRSYQPEATRMLVAITKQLKKWPRWRCVYLTNLINVTCATLGEWAWTLFYVALWLCVGVSFCRAARIHRGNKL